MNPRIKGMLEFWKKQINNRMVEQKAKRKMYQNENNKKPSQYRYSFSMTFFYPINDEKQRFFFFYNSQNSEKLKVELLKRKIVILH